MYSAMKSVFLLFVGVFPAHFLVSSFIVYRTFPATDDEFTAGLDSAATYCSTVAMRP
jgi:hypothetical protein